MLLRGIQQYSAMIQQWCSDILATGAQIHQRGCFGLSLGGRTPKHCPNFAQNGLFDESAQLSPKCRYTIAGLLPNVAECLVYTSTTFGRVPASRVAAVSAVASAEGLVLTHAASHNKSANNMHKGASADRPGLVSAIPCVAAVPNCSICERLGT